MSCTASDMMKLVYYFLCMNSFNFVYSERVEQGPFPYPPKFLMANSLVSTDNSIYLSPELHTPAPHLFANIYHSQPSKPPPLQMPDIFSVSTVNYGDGNIIYRGEKNERHDISSTTPAPYTQTTTKIKQEAERRNFGNIPQPFNYKQPIDRMDTKTLIQSSGSKETTKMISINQNPMPKGLIISADNSKNLDLDQTASYHNMHYAPPPHVIVQSTTEPAIPILRLSNEMDLDGSFSYEALGADHTHYVQHSRMENIGTDKEGPIVEGSYSYVGDDGQTYTVHYIADSNGYRATGDHLPVPPPIPEIIQRSIQYNLAEEAKRPPNFQSIHNNENESSSSSNENINVKDYTLPGKLFTGQTPEAFSFAFQQGTNSQNNLTPMTNAKEPVKRSFQLSDDNIKTSNNYGPLEPQITFLASQGAHTPSLNSVPRPPMPQLVNYESGMKELDQDNNKGLWRWQYGVNSKSDNENLPKDSISRSSSEGDDIIINFSDMTPEQYQKMMGNQQTEDIQTKSDNNFDNQPLQNVYSYNKNYINNNLKLNNGGYSVNQMNNETNNSDRTSAFATQSSLTFTSSGNSYDGYNDNYKNHEHRTDNVLNRYKITQDINDFTRAPYTESTPGLDYENRVHGSENTMFPSYESYYQTKYLNYDNNYNLNKNINSNLVLSNNNENNNKLKLSETENISTPTPIEYKYVIQHKDIERSNKHLTDTENPDKKVIPNNKPDSTTPEIDIKEAVRQNIFLKSLLTPNLYQSHKEGLKKDLQAESNLITIPSTTPVSIYNETKSYNDIKTIERRPLDVSDVLKYIVNNNIYESNRLKTKSRPILFKSLPPLNNLSEKPELIVNTNYDFKIKDNVDHFRITNNNLRQDPPQQELQGNIKNYKVLLRNNAKNANSEATKEIQTQPMSKLQNKNIYPVNKYPPLGRAGPSMKSYLPPIYL